MIWSPPFELPFTTHLLRPDKWLFRLQLHHYQISVSQIRRISLPMISLEFSETNSDGSFLNTLSRTSSRLFSLHCEG
jgi:hypothetical protein